MKEKMEGDVEATKLAEVQHHGKERRGLFGNIKFFQKLKSIKHIEIIIAVVLGAIVLLIYLSTLSKNSSQTSYEQTSTTEYAIMLEEKLASTISQIEGVGNVRVMITLASGPEYIYATADEEKSNTNISNGTTTSSTTTTSEPVIISNDIVVVKEIMPAVSGVVVVAGGAGDTKVKLEILKTIQALLDVPQGNIEVLVGK